MDGWEDKIYFRDGPFSGAMFVLAGVITQIQLQIHLERNKSIEGCLSWSL